MVAQTSMNYSEWSQKTLRKSTNDRTRSKGAKPWKKQYCSFFLKTLTITIYSLKSVSLSSSAAPFAWPRSRFAYGSGMKIPWKVFLEYAYYQDSFFQNIEETASHNFTVNQNFITPFYRVEEIFYERSLPKCHSLESNFLIFRPFFLVAYPQCFRWQSFWMARISRLGSTADHTLKWLKSICRVCGWPM